jgi:hypothetical protein
LDLSYRAQLNGWKFIYLEDVGTPAELPVEMRAFRAQQFRWNKGAAECARKNLMKVICQSTLSLRTRVHALFHLLSSTVFFFILLCSVLSIPVLMIKASDTKYDWIYYLASSCALSVVILAIVHYTAAASRNAEAKQNPVLRFVRYFPLFLSVYMGMALHNSVAVCEGWLGKKSAFHRTPKFNVITPQQAWTKNKYAGGRTGIIIWMEALLALYFSAGILISFLIGDLGLLPFYFLLAFGFGFVSTLSFNHAIRKPALG